MADNAAHRPTGAAAGSELETTPFGIVTIGINEVIGEATGHDHPHMQTATANYRRLLAAMDLPTDEIERRMQEVLEA